MTANGRHGHRGEAVRCPVAAATSTRLELLLQMQQGLATNASGQTTSETLLAATHAQLTAPGIAGRPGVAAAHPAAEEYSLRSATSQRQKPMVECVQVPPRRINLA